MKKPYCTIIDGGSGSSVNDLCAQNDVILWWHHIFYDFCNFLTVFLLQSGFKPCIALIIKQTSGALNIENNKLVFCISSNNFRTHWSVANNNNTKTKTSKSKLSNEIQAIKSYYATLCKVARMRKSVLSKFCKSSRTMSLTISFNLPMNRSVLWLLLSMLFQNIGDEKHAIHGENLLSSVKKSCNCLHFKSACWMSTFLGNAFSFTASTV